MTALIVVLPLIVVVEISLQLHRPLHYPRVKLLDIYRTIQTLPSFAKYPDGFMEVQLLTQGKISEPLAFIIPDKEEEVRNHVVMLERYNFWGT
jgi:hypothetical protein